MNPNPSINNIQSIPVSIFPLSTSSLSIDSVFESRHPFSPQLTGLVLPTSSDPAFLKFFSFTSLNFPSSPTSTMSSIMEPMSLLDMSLAAEPVDFPSLQPFP